MKEIHDGHWQIDSAFEAEIIARVAGFGQPDAHSKYILRHSRNLEVTSNELEFFNREQKYGKLTIGKSLAASAEAGLSAIETNGESYEGVTVDMATMCLGIIRRSREARVVALPEGAATIKAMDTRRRQPLADSVDLTAA